MHVGCIKYFFFCQDGCMTFFFICLVSLVNCINFLMLNYPQMNIDMIILTWLCCIILGVDFQIMEILFRNFHLSLMSSSSLPSVLSPWPCCPHRTGCEGFPYSRFLKDLVKNQYCLFFKCLGLEFSLYKRFLKPSFFIGLFETFIGLWSGIIYLFFIK